MLHPRPGWTEQDPSRWWDAVCRNLQTIFQSHNIDKNRIAAVAVSYTHLFAIICEELGLFGAVSIILIFLFMIYRFMIIANNAPDLFGALLVVGVMGHIAIQVILNIAVVTNTIPNPGITLPFISYGGTSVLFLLMEMGIVLSVSNQIKLEK